MVHNISKLGLSLASISRTPFPSLIHPTQDTIAHLAAIGEKIGFLIITEHPAPLPLLEEVCSSSQSFARHPEDIKVTYHKREQLVTPKTCRGYSADGEDVLSPTGLGGR